jgi:hypothetical protein
MTEFLSAPPSSLSVQSDAIKDDTGRLIPHIENL